jgi:DNA-binding Xre family transcriptional regulator
MDKSKTIHILKRIAKMMSVIQDELDAICAELDITKGEIDDTPNP